MRLSDRMEAVASMVTPGSILADVGTDHGHVPIALAEQKKIPKAIAMDLRLGPLERARENITLAGLEGSIETRLSDGVGALKPQEADSIVIAGMGGEVIIHILDAGRAVCKSAKELILQPQSELGRVRRFLEREAYRILDEDMVCEDHKFYTIIKIVPLAGGFGLSEPEALYGPVLLQKRHPVLFTYLQWEQEQLNRIQESLQAQAETDKILLRMEELERKRSCNRKAQSYFSYI